MISWSFIAANVAGSLFKDEALFVSVGKDTDLTGAVMMLAMTDWSTSACAVSSFATLLSFDFVSFMMLAMAPFKFWSPQPLNGFL